MFLKDFLLTNYILARKIGDPQKGTYEGHTAFITSTELFFIFLSLFFVLVGILPFKLNAWVFAGVFIVIWYFCFYALRSGIVRYLVESEAGRVYMGSEKSTLNRGLMLGVLWFVFSFIIFFITGVLYIGGYFKY